MASFTLSSDHAQLTPIVLAAYQKRCMVLIQQLRNAQTQKYDSAFASINLSTDTEYHNTITTLATEKRALNPAAIVIIGIGGSSLGTKAIWQAIQPSVSRPGPELIFAETIDPDLIAHQCAQVESYLKSKKTVILIVISKSGSTTETSANFLIFKQLLEKYHPKNSAHYIVAITDAHSALWNYAQEEGYAHLAIPKEVGGRYSVFSAVGLFPLALAGVDIQSLCAGASSIIETCLDELTLSNPALTTATFIDYHYQKGACILDLFFFSMHLQELGNWYRQLVAESLGKQREQKRYGITPTVSIGTTDLHSMVQLYLAGPPNRCTLFVTVEKFHHQITLPDDTLLNPLLAHTSYATLMDAIERGVQHAYTQQQLPWMALKLPQLDPYAIGQFMQYSMITIMYVGMLWGISPFDQPQVELYKKETQRILAHE